MSKSSFHKVHYKCAYFLSNFPHFKKFIKFIFIRLIFIFNRKKYKIRCNYPIISVNSNYETFFGYYDSIPTNNRGFVLCHLSRSSTKCLPSPNNPINVALFSPDLQFELWSSKSYAYNWQQGSRLQWLDDDYFIYNDFSQKSQTYVSKVVSSLLLKETEVFNFPVQASFKKNYFLSVNYQRLITLNPDYGYRNKPKLSLSQLSKLSNDGIWKTCFRQKQSSLFISLEMICDFGKKNIFEKSKHCVNHIMISPNGNKFIFIHRYYYKSRRYDRLFLADSETSELQLLSEYGMVSHCCWENNNRILCYMKGSDLTFGYWFVSIPDGKFAKCNYFNGFGDGHPTVSADFVITDTYPDKSRMNFLNVFNVRENRLHEIGQFYHSFSYSGQSRCDLHPRFCSNSKSIFIDTIHGGKRKLQRVSVNDL